MVAQAMDKPSKVAVPRPISSRMTRARGPARLSIAAVSTISTMKVERPRARSSAAPTRLNRRSTAPREQARAARNNGLREHRDQRVLPQEGALAGHVGAGEQPQPGAGRKGAIVGDELAVAGAHSLDDRVAPALDMEVGSVVHFRPAIAAFDSERGAGGGDVDFGEGGCGGGDVVGAGGDLAHEVVEQFELERQRAVAGAGESCRRVRPARRWRNARPRPWSGGG